MAVALSGVGRRSRTVRTREALEAAVHCCLGRCDGQWLISADPSSTLSGWWILDLARQGAATHLHVFVDASKNVQAQVCRRLAEAIPGDCQDGGACAPMPEGTAVRIEIDPSVPASVAERFAAAAKSVFERRAGAYRVRVAAGRSADEVALLVGASRRPTPFPLYFPRASELGPDDVTRILVNVLEGLGPCWSAFAKSPGGQ